MARANTHIEFSSPVCPWIRSRSRGAGCVDSRTRRVQFLNVIREVLFRSGMFEDPLDGNKDKENENDRKKSREQTNESQACCILPINQPNQSHPHYKEQDECAQCKTHISLFCVFTQIFHDRPPIT